MKCSIFDCILRLVCIATTVCAIILASLAYKQSSENKARTQEVVVALINTIDRARGLEYRIIQLEGRKRCPCVDRDKKKGGNKPLRRPLPPRCKYCPTDKDLHDAVRGL